MSQTSKPVKAPRFDGARLRERREHVGASVEALAMAIDRSSYTVAAYERGQQQPTAESLGALAAALGCSVSDFYA